MRPLCHRNVNRRPFQTSHASGTFFEVPLDHFFGHLVHVKTGAVTLTHAGFQRHRLLWVREMTEEEIRHVGETGSTIDSIEVAEFESHAALKEWLTKKAPAFTR